MKIFTVPMIVFSALMIGGCTLLPVTEKNETTEETPTISPTATITPTVDEAGVIKATIKKALVAKHGEGANILNVTVSKIMGNYSQGGASGEGGGGMWFAAKVNNEWKLVWDGNGIILCEDLKNYPDFPSSMIQGCYDQKADKLITR